MHCVSWYCIVAWCEDICNALYPMYLRRLSLYIYISSNGDHDTQNERLINKHITTHFHSLSKRKLLCPVFSFKSFFPTICCNRSLSCLATYHAFIHRHLSCSCLQLHNNLPSYSRMCPFYFRPAHPTDSQSIARSTTAYCTLGTFRWPGI